MRFARPAVALAIPLVAVAALAGGSREPARAASPRVVANDNRAPAGTLRGGVLTLRLEARLAEWHPDGEDAPGAVVPAFAEAGKRPTIPGPLVRVPAGTEVALTVRNALRDTLSLGGVHDRPADTTLARGLAAAMRPAVVIAPGATRTVRFRLTTPGTYLYWGTTSGRTIEMRTREDVELSGAIVVDEPGRPAPADRIFVIGMWTDTISRAMTHRRRILATINGRSWPHTERLEYATGDTARWRVINASADAHPMHLHGFYFEVASRGDGRGDTTFAPGARRRVVTENLLAGTTMTIAWVPERAGNWLFHCHIPEHFSPRAPLGLARDGDSSGMAAAHAHDAANHALGGMSGLVMGIHVRQAPGTVAAAAADDSTRRALRLVVRARADTAGGPRYAYDLEGATPTGWNPDAVLAPPIVLVRGEPARITVVNASGVPTAVHWHGIELESYYDGVPGFSGTDARPAPMIAPGDSFVALMTPPRAGTFIYHTHADEETQQREGLAGPLVVLEPGAHWNPVSDRAVMLGTPRTWEEEQRAVTIDGSTAPPPLTMRAGASYRLRVVNMTLRRPGLMVSVRGDTGLVAWRPLAKDGADLPATRQAPRPARTQISIGETFDFELVPGTPGTLRLEVRMPNGQLLGARRIDVLASRSASR